MAIIVAVPSEMAAELSEPLPTVAHWLANALGKATPWTTVERLIGSIRRECLDHVIVLGERHLKRILGAYFEYYHQARTHLSLDRNAPVPREVEPPSRGRLLCIPQVGGLHHRYRRIA